MKWTPRTYGSAKAPAFESGCLNFTVVKNDKYGWRLIIDRVNGAFNPSVHDFKTAEAAKAYAEAQA
jgi:hypothetical protein